jgi:hypothetical protein
LKSAQKDRRVKKKNQCCHRYVPILYLVFLP